jgi:pSer/pThr/pTyr-binding forkhead associated (FHA) protein
MLSSTTLVRSEPAPTPAVLVGPGGRRVSLAGAAVVLGRHRDCDLVLADDRASRRHARVEPVPAGYALVDLGSTNGTFLNGVRLSGAVVLGDGDRIEVGHSLVRFVLRATGAGSSPEADRHLAL